jgi:2-iminobutanoate/2-iminopropanoate deaminase
MTQTVFNPPGAPPRLGPYNHAIKVGNLVFLSGQVPIDPAHPSGPISGDIKAQTRRVIENIRIILESAGSGLRFVVKTTVFMTNLAEFPGMNEVYAELFPAPHPARSTVQVAALPRGAAIEIEAIALAGKS